MVYNSGNVKEKLFKTWKRWYLFIIFCLHQIDEYLNKYVEMVRLLFGKTSIVASVNSLM